MEKKSLTSRQTVFAFKITPNVLPQATFISFIEYLVPEVIATLEWHFQFTQQMTISLFTTPATESQVDWKSFKLIKRGFLSKAQSKSLLVNGLLECDAYSKRLCQTILRNRDWASKFDHWPLEFEFSENPNIEIVLLGSSYKNFDLLNGRNIGS